ncbi:MAG: hypothetical protein IKS65_03130 [Bacteroidales bacterium]|nr:hypothetical protein [Bacteroidales bacterium]
MNNNRCDNSKQKDKKKGVSEGIMGLIALAVIILGLFIMISFVWLGGTTKWMNTLGAVLLAYIFILMVVWIVLRPIENKRKITKALYKFADWNMQAWTLLVALVLPASLLLFGLVFIVVVPFALMFGLLKLLSLVTTIDSNAILFIALTIGGIISAHYSKPMFWFISKTLTMNHHRYEEHYKRMVEYVYQPANLQFVVYFLYIVYLVVSTIYTFQTCGQPLWGQEQDLAVLESFLVFIAFSNMRSKREMTKFKLSELFIIMCAIWTTRDIIDEDGNGTE